MCTGEPASTADFTRATDRIRNGATILAGTITSSVPEDLIAQAGDQIEQVVSNREEHGQANVTGSAMSMWAGSYRWTIRANVSRTRTCSEEPQRRTGTYSVGSETGRTTSDRSQATGSSTATLGGSAGPEEHRGTGSVSGTTGHERERTTGGSSRATETLGGTGPQDIAEEQWNYRVTWTVTVEMDPESMNPMMILPRIINAMSGMGGPYSEHGEVDIGSVTILHADPTPAATPRRGGARTRTPETHRPERLVGSGG